jgi:hypothetical protein
LLGLCEDVKAALEKLEKIKIEKQKIIDKNNTLKDEN